MKDMKSIVVYIFLAFNCFYYADCQTWPRFHLYRKNSPNTYVSVTASNLTTSGYDPNKESKFLIHGFGDSGLTTTMLSIKNEILKTTDVNVFVVDWREGAAAPNYLGAASNVKVTGPKMAEFIQQAGINPQKVHCIGHSLGAHACGFCGKVVKLNRISGLDPAGPLFANTPGANRLDKEDAYYVDNIHTDVIFGIQQAIGHKDFYPNGGRSQAGCYKNTYEPQEYIKISFSNDTRFDPVELVACSHVRVPFFYAESVNSNCNFPSVPCDTYDNYKLGKCSCNPIYGCASMGHKSNKTAETGKFFLKTAETSPFCLP